jgi:amino acid transporter
VTLLFGRPLSSGEDVKERIGPAAGIPVFGLDALSSAAYGPEAALAILIPLGVAGVTEILPISLAIIALLSVVYFSYRQTIAAYPMGGGSYTVASDNLGTQAGMLAGASLMIDYIFSPRSNCHGIRKVRAVEVVPEQQACLESRTRR